ncbi:nucleotidyl transferase AbiEii/AbiGii toxin family protein [Candidatus Margulisiibacteriota bacterium]
MKKINPEILLEPIQALQKLMEISGCKWTVIGGIASSLLGKPRFTADVDAVILIELEEIPKIIKNAAKVGIKPRIRDIESFARKNRVILLQHNNSGINLDLSIGLLPFEIEAVENSKKRKVGKIAINLPTVEDLIIFKAVASRQKDLLDIDELVNTNKQIDKKKILRILKEFADILDKPEILIETEKILHKK